MLPFKGRPQRRSSRTILSWLSFTFVLFTDPKSRRNLWVSPLDPSPSGNGHHTSNTSNFSLVLCQLDLRNSNSEPSLTFNSDYAKLYFSSYSGVQTSLLQPLAFSHWALRALFRSLSLSGVFLQVNLCNAVLMYCSNYQQRSLYGFRISTLLGWLGGDAFKLRAL